MHRRDQSATRHFFVYLLVGRNRSVQLTGAPWDFLAEPIGIGVNIDPKIEAEALFSAGPMVPVRDEEEAQFKKEDDAIRKATGLVWRQYMLRDFDRAVSERDLRLFARIGSVTAPFDQLPRRHLASPGDHRLAERNSGRAGRRSVLVDPRRSDPQQSPAVYGSDRQGRERGHQGPCAGASGELGADT